MDKKKQLFPYFCGIKEHTLKFVWGSIILHNYVQSTVYQIVFQYII